MGLNGAYLSGWEYNRLLGADPTIARNSALPGEVLWNGAAPFWLFERVYCTAESLSNERAAFEILGWPTGQVFTELASEGLLEPISWAGLDENTQSLLKSQHASLRAASPAQTVRSAIVGNNSSALETIKIELVGPIARAMRAVVPVAPSSLRTWYQNRPTPGSGHGEPDMEASLRITRLLGELSAPVRTLDLLRPPGWGVSETDLRAHKAVQDTVEAPMIPDLIAGEGPFGGAQGYIPYLEALADHREAYQAINDRMRDDWRSNRARLYGLREAAKTHLWPQLHGDWLPRLVEGDSQFAKRFPYVVATALAAQPIARFLTKPARLSFAAGAIGLGVGKVLTAMAGLTDEPGVTLVTAAAAGGGGALGTAIATELRPYTDLALFYHRALREQ